jgi:hypothetical protein
MELKQVQQTKWEKRRTHLALHRRRRPEAPHTASVLSINRAQRFKRPQGAFLVVPTASDDETMEMGGALLVAPME